MIRQYYKRVPASGLYEPEGYNNIHVYIVDDPGTDAPKRHVMGKEIQEKHALKCDLIRDLFKEYSDFEIHSVCFPMGAKGKDVTSYWMQELQSKTSDDLLIIYFHGKAGGEGVDYKWTHSQYPKITINAYRLIEKIVACPAHSLLLLDCFLQTRLKEKWTRAAGTTEIMMRPECMQTPDGKVMEHEGDFTEVVVDNLSKYIEMLQRRKSHKSLQPKTIPEIMKFDKNMYSTSQRTWLDRTKKGDNRVVKRVKLDPNLMRDDGKLAFVSVQIQGDPEDAAEEAAINAAAEAEKEGNGVDAENDLHEDEGFGDDDDMTPVPEGAGTPNDNESIFVTPDA